MEPIFRYRIVVDSRSIGFELWRGLVIHGNIEPGSARRARQGADESVRHASFRAMGVTRGVDRSHPSRRHRTFAAGSGTAMVRLLRPASRLSIGLGNTDRLSSPGAG